MNKIPVTRPDDPHISIVVPVYNEEDALEAFLVACRAVLETITKRWEIIYVNDGSTDGTLGNLMKLCQREGRIRIINLSRNFGKEAALTAGLDATSGDVVIPADVDLQDPPQLIPEMLQKWKEGADVVVAVRKSRKGDSILRRLGASGYYRMLGKSANIHIPEHAGDFRLMDRRVVNALKRFPERTRYMKGIFAWVGFPGTEIYYDRPARMSGKSRQGIRKLWKLAWDGLFSFSTMPLKISTFFGFIVSAGAFFYAITIIIKVLFLGVSVPGYASLITVILFMGGIQLISLGIIGEYIGRIFRETKERPLYIVSEKIGFEEE